MGAETDEVVWLVHNFGLCGGCSGMSAKYFRSSAGGQIR